MQIVWKAPVSLEEYVALGKEVEFPVPKECPVCRRKVNLKRHGWYLRYAVREDLEVQVWIPREDPKLKAMKLREMVGNFPAEEFSLLFHQRFDRSFMAI